MSGAADSAFVRGELVAERSPPRPRRAIIASVREWLASPTHILLLALVPLLIWLIVIPAVEFLLFNAVWSGSDREACLSENTGHVVGACWPYVAAKSSQFIYGFYPENARWRVNLTFILAAALLLPLLIPRLPAKGLNAALFFLAFPVVAFFLLRGGGLNGFALSWCVGLLESTAHGLTGAGQAMLGVSSSVHSGLSDALVSMTGRIAIAAGRVLEFALTPLILLRNEIRATGQALWSDFLISALAIVLFLWWRAGARAARTAVVSLVAIAAVIKVMALDAGGLALIDTRLWGGLLVTLVIAVTGIVASMPIGIALALARRSSLPLIRISAIIFIEFWRGVPLITVLFFATYMLPLFLPGHFSIDGLLRALIGVAIFAGAYQAEVIRGGLAAIPAGQSEAAAALGLSWSRITFLIELPQALRHVIPALVNSFIALFKDTSLVAIVALFDLLGSLQASLADPVWSTPTTAFTGFAFAGILYFAFCFAMSRYSLFVERRLNAHRAK